MAKVPKNLTASIRQRLLDLSRREGRVFDADGLRAETIKEDQEYGGIRLKTIAYLGKTRIPITIDIGFGDAMTDRDYSIDYPSLLGMPPASIRAYPPVTVVAEKFQAIVALGLVNSRMKDYYDLWAIHNTQSLKARDLDDAIQATFERRGTDIPREMPIGLSADFVNDEQKVRQWGAYIASIDHEELSLDTVVEVIRSYTGPACARLTST